MDEKFRTRSSFKGEPLVEIETDKVTQELYAEDNGVIKELLFKSKKK